MSVTATGALAERYSAALFELADEQGALDAVAADLKSLRAMSASSEDLKRMLRSPVLSRTEQQKAVAAIGARAGFGELTNNFLGLLATHRRLFALDGITGAFLARLAAKRGEITAEVVSAAPLTDAQVKAVEAALIRALGGHTGGSQVALDAKVDPSLLGGMLVKFGSRLIDGSLKTKLQRMKLAMKGIG